MSDIFRAEIRIPLEMLDHVYQGICECGWKRDFGYMATTAQTECDWHAEKHGHDVTLVESPAEPLPRGQSIAKITKAGQRGRQAAKIVLDVPTQGRT